MNGFSPNLVYALILWRSGLGLIMGNFVNILQNYLPATQWSVVGEDKSHFYYAGNYESLGLAIFSEI